MKEAKPQSQAVLDLSDKASKPEIDQRSKHIIVLTTASENENAATDLFKDIITVGLEQLTVPLFKVIQCKKDANIFKLKLVTR